MKLSKRMLSVVSAAALAATMTSAISGSADSNVLITNGGPYTGNASYISTYLKSDYFGKESFKITYKYNSLDSDGKYTDETGEHDIDYTDTFEFLAFDTNWLGWDKTSVGTAEPNTSDTYTATVSIADIEKTLSTGGTNYGINLQTGGIGDTSVSILSLEYVDAVVPGAEVDITGEWTKGTGGTMTVQGSGAAVSTNEWNIEVSQFSVSGFENPTVDITVTYDTAPNNYVQAEILDKNGTPVVANYPLVDVTGTYTYTTEISEDMTSFLACYDQCTVKRIHIYDNHEKNALKVSGQTANTINSNLTPCWNLGNAFDSVSDEGTVGETVWGNPVVTEKLFQTVRDQGFKSVRIPVSYLDMVDANGDINDDYLNRVQAVVDRAMDTGLYVILNVHHDGSDGITGKWLDISKSGAEFDNIVTRYSGMWREIAQKFVNYDQALIFEGMNEVMISNVYTRDQFTKEEFDRVYNNIFLLNQAFVDEVRATGPKNTDRVLIIPGYNTDINLTEAGFEELVYGEEYTAFDLPTDSIPNRLVLSVHYYDPYNFTLNEYGTDSWDINGEYGAEYIASQIAKVTDKGVPVFIGEYCANFKNNNVSTVASFAKALNEKAHTVNNVSVSTAYWDNGVIGNGGSGLIDRRFNTVTSNGAVVIAQIMSVYNP